MESIYIFIVGAIVLLAISDLIVGVSNDAVNFLNSAIGSKVISFRNIMILASIGVAVGAVSSNGMMEIARKGIFNPEAFFFDEIMIIFLAVMITDILILDLFNSWGLPTSTTVSIVFELLGAAVVMSIIKIMNSSGNLSDLNYFINTEKASEIILGILLSIFIAFSIGAIIQWLSRLILTFNFEKKSIYLNSIFGALSLSSIINFILIKGIKGTQYSDIQFDQLNVLKTSIDLSDQNNVDEKFKSNSIGILLVNIGRGLNNMFISIAPKSLLNKIEKSFDSSGIDDFSASSNRPSFDKLRASLNLVVAAILISIATSFTLPLSTTYVTFMVAMGTSLSDRAWGKESAIYRVSGVVSVIGGWFLTAFSAFSICGLIVFLIHIGNMYSIIAIIITIALIIYKNHIKFKKKGDIKI